MKRAIRHHVLGHRFLPAKIHIYRGLFFDRRAVTRVSTIPWHGFTRHFQKFCRILSYLASSANGEASRPRHRHFFIGAAAMTSPQ
jgi:hypothetical protein